jgi:hypothetical protein
MAFLGGQLLSSKPTLAQGLSRDLGQSLQGLAQHKATQMQNQKKISAYKKAGIPDQLAELLPLLSEKERSGVLEQIDWSQALQQQPQQQDQQQAPIQNQMQQSQQQQPTYTPEQEQVIRRSQNPEERQKIADLFRQHNQQQAQPQQVITPNQQAGQAAAQQQIVQQQQPSIFKNKANTAQEANDIRRAQHEFAKEQKQQNDIDKKYQKLTEQYEKDFTLGSQLEVLANEMAALNEEIGENWSPFKEAGVEGIRGATKGLVDLRSVAGQKAEEFRNKANQYVHLASGSIKGLPSKFRVQILEASKPSLFQTYGARKNIISDAEKFAGSLQVPFQEQLKLMEENGGKLPADFSSRAIPSIKEKQREILTGKKQELEFDTLEEAQEYARQHGAKAIENTETKKKFKV